MGVHVDVRPVHLCIPASNIKHLVHSIMYMLLVVYYKESGILILGSTPCSCKMTLQCYYKVKKADLKKKKL